MTASIAPDPPGSAPQAMSEQHTSLVVDNIQERAVWRFWMLVLFFVTLACLVLVPLFIHQIIQYGQVRTPGLPHQAQSPRGAIVDRNGELLAADRYFYQVTTTPKHFADSEERLKVADQLEELASIPAAKTYDLLSSYPLSLYIELAPVVSLEAGQRILDKQAELEETDGAAPLLHVNLTPAPKRYYPENQLGAHIVGVMARLNDSAWLEGYYGLEGYYDNFLRAARR